MTKPAADLQGQVPVREKCVCTAEDGCGERKNVRSFHRYRDGSYHLKCKRCYLRGGYSKWKEGAGKDLKPFGGKMEEQTNANRLKGDQTRAAYVEAVKSGMTHAKALQFIKRTDGTYREWRARYPEWAALVDATRSKMYRDRREEAASGEQNEAGFAPYRKKYFNHETYEHQMRLVHALESTKPQEITLCLMFPEAGKTTTLVDWICYTLDKDPNHRFGIISEGPDLARDIVGQLQKRMNPDEPSQWTISRGPFYEEGQERRGKSWTLDHFSVVRCSHDEKDPSVAAAGWGKKIYGKRWDTLIIDDIQSQESIAATEKMLKYIRLTCLSRVGKAGKTVIVGTRVGVGDVYQRMLEEDLPHNVIRIQALKDDGTSACPEMWPDDALAEKRRQVGEELWATAYMQQPSSSAMIVFTQDAVDGCKDHDRGVGGMDSVHSNLVTVDPALVGGNAMFGLGMTAEKLYILDCQKEYNLAQQERILVGIQSYAARYRPGIVIVEQNAYQKSLANDVRLRAMADTYKFQVLPHTTSRNKSDSFFGVSAMAQSFHMGEVRLPWKDDLAKLRMRALLKELDDWRPNTPPKLLEQDLIMALWFGWNYWMTQRKFINPKPVNEPRPAWMTDSNWKAKQLQQNAERRRRRAYVA